MAWMHSPKSKFCHKKKKMFGRNHTRYYQTLLIWVISWIKTNAEKAGDSYDYFFDAELCFPDERKRKIISRVTKHLKENQGNPRGIEHPVLFEDHSFYFVSFPNVKMEELTANLIADNMLSEVYSEKHHYQVLKNISDHSTDVRALKKSYGF